MKKCTRCNSEKEETEFYPRVPWCKACRAEYSRQYHAEQKEAGPYGLVILKQFISKIYRDQVVTVDDPRLARPYVTYYNANITRRRLAKRGFDVKIVHLKT